jgi:uncharacterized protein YndB with AHSA1/START domain
MSKPIHQEVDFKASPQQVYAALTDAKRFSAFSGLPSLIDCQGGGAFKCFGGQITGRFIELTPNQRIVQTWHVAMWPDGVDSTVKFQLKEQGSGTASFWITQTSPRRTVNISMLDGHGCIGNH